MTSFVLVSLPLQRKKERRGVNFINVIRTAFAHVDPKSVKRYGGFDLILTLLGDTSVKALRRTLMKLSPDAPPESSTSMSKFPLWDKISLCARALSLCQSPNPQWGKNSIFVHLILLLSKS